jgi:glutamate/tyrosine decarboxylase-like PLP-dependent enzyme
MQGMHGPTPQDAAAARRLADWVLARLADRRCGLPPAPPADLPPLPREGVGAEQAVARLLDLVLPSALPSDHPRYLAYVPGAPTVVSALVEAALSAASAYAGARLEAPALIAAEDAVLRWLADAAGLPESAGGTFVSGGSLANLGALVAARGDRGADRGRQAIVTGASAHSSLTAAGRVMGCDVVAAAPADAHGRLDAATLEEALGDRDPRGVVAVVATAGATNTGAVDDLAGVSAVCRERGLWLHVDAAYGGAALLSARARPLFDGIEGADSLTIDPHKWLFAPYDCAAVIYRDPIAAARSHAQSADYLYGAGEGASGEGGEVDPSDLAVHLTRRARGVPLWASVLAYGTDAYVEAVDTCLDTARYAADAIRSHPRLELALEPELTVVLFRRPGWTAPDYAAWSDASLRRGLAVVTPTRHAGESVLRLCFVNPLTAPSDVDLVLSGFE